MWKKEHLDVKIWVEECEKDFHHRLTEVADQLLAIHHLKMIRLAGPTCSGKTTLANLLQSRFAQAGKHLHLISIDDFYYDKTVLHARTGQGQIDYDSVHTIDLLALRNFTEEIFSADAADCPIFDFVQGKRTGFRRMESKEDDVFLFEGIQVLYPELRELFAQFGESVGLYIAPQRSLTVGGTTWEPNEIRLLRRLVRDAHFRNTSPEKTFFLWSGVRENEEANIFPYVKDCPYRIDSTMPYELGVLKPYLNEILPAVAEDSPYRSQAEDILKKLEGIDSVSDAMIPMDSLYREFI